MSDIQIKRVYEPHSADDGQRVLVDRVWPRGISKVTLKDAIWLKEIAPSTELRNGSTIGPSAGGSSARVTPQSSTAIRMQSPSCAHCAGAGR
jgi:hypothetical protein